jgi:hypothetical protein
VSPSALFVAIGQIDSARLLRWAARSRDFASRLVLNCLPGSPPVFYSARRSALFVVLEPVHWKYPRDSNFRCCTDSNSPSSLFGIRCHHAQRTSHSSRAPPFRSLHGLQLRFAPWKFGSLPLFQPLWLYGRTRPLAAGNTPMSRCCSEPGVASQCLSRHFPAHRVRESGKIATPAPLPAVGSD